MLSNPAMAYAKGRCVLGIVALLFLLSSLVRGDDLDPSTEVFGYDCSSPGVKTHPVSLMGVGDCTAPSQAQSLKDEYAQIIQLSTLTRLEVKSCRVLKSYSVFRCGMHSHSMLVGGPFINEPVRLSKSDCEDMHKSKRYIGDDNHSMEHLKINQTTTVALTQRGWLDSDGSCEGTSFTLHGITYHKSFIRVSLSVYLSTYFTEVATDTDQILLKDHLSCPHIPGHCFDDIVGLSYWTPFDSDCSSQVPYQLYKGPVQILKDDKNISIIRVKHDSFMFVSVLKPMSIACGRRIFPTDFQNVIVLIMSTHNPTLNISPPRGKSISPVLYTNAKLSYLHYQTVEDLTAIYSDIVYKLCNLERKVLENTLNIMRLSSANTVKVEGIGGRGTLVSVQGEVAYLTTCPIKKVTLRSSNLCYNGIPISVNGSDKFLAPVSRMIVDQAQEVKCSLIHPPMYLLGDVWVASYPAMTRIHDPVIISPQQPTSPKLTTIGGFSEGGIYSPSEIKEFYTSITFGNTRSAIIDHLAISIADGTPTRYNIAAVISDEGWKDIAKKHLQSIWGVFVGLGEVISGLIGVYLVYTIISRTLSMIMRGWALHQLYGCSWKILGSIWSATTIFFQTGAGMTSMKPKKPSNEVELSDLIDEPQTSIFRLELDPDIRPVTP